MRPPRTLLLPGLLLAAGCAAGGGGTGTVRHVPTKVAGRTP